MANSPVTHLFNTVRGALIGTAEVVPGISGGTVALIVGVYEGLVKSAGHTISGIRLAVADLPRKQGLGRAKAEFGQADWTLILTVLAGMAVAVVLAARFVAPLVETYAIESYGLFFGLVLASLWVPYSMSGRRWGSYDYAVALLFAVIAFILTGVPPAHVEPVPLVVAVAAAVAICALVIPGMSGSFILLTFGLYGPTMNALNERDLGYIATFAAGAIVGLACFVKLLQWLLDNRRHMTLVIMTGVMAGSLRALWPWQDDARGLTLPTEAAAVTFGLMAVGFVVVVGIMVLEHLVKKPAPAAVESEPVDSGQHRSS
ncbi:DUF368 domain-containing protein [Nocardiopsis ansamitocini]|uniref:DUF368 domain-containing protein n=1 Tax=Nocardiopsis ansamitocini TaxID=1670832 RepID=A0A9W6P680_9ACTN|nr:DUF368 domain-containing protein [Nocardiopsis ansamitocini]GLU47803.1 DUF368 domain-containing protein [Nocardiopsis ansamitocini]